MTCCFEKKDAGAFFQVRGRHMGWSKAAQKPGLTKDDVVVGGVPHHNRLKFQDLFHKFLNSFVSIRCENAPDFKAENC